MTKQEEICKSCQYLDVCDKSVIEQCLEGKCPWRGGRGLSKIDSQMNLAQRVYYWLWHDFRKRDEPYTATWRRWVRAHPKLAIGIPVAGFLTWWLLYAHILGLW